MHIYIYICVCVCVREIIGIDGWGCGFHTAKSKDI